jgi:hypothetical protein
VAVERFWVVFAAAEGFVEGAEVVVGPDLVLLNTHRQPLNHLQRRTLIMQRNQSVFIIRLRQKQGQLLTPFLAKVLKLERKTVRYLVRGEAVIGTFLENTGQHFSPWHLLHHQ